MKRTIWDCAHTVQVTVDRPANEVWPYLFPPKSGIWSKQDYEHVAGESGKVGEIYAVNYRDGRFLHETIKAQPERHLILKLIYQQSEGDEGELMGYDTFTLNEIGGRTIVVMQQAFALPVEESAEDLNVKTESHGKFLSETLVNLKKVVESSR